MLFPHRIFSTLLSALPGLFFYAFLSVMSAGQYWQPVYQIAGAAFIVSSALSGLVLATLFQSERSRFRAAAAVFCAVVLGWLAFTCVLGLANLTPLCVGQDNDDGNNDVAMCILIAVLSTAVYTPLIFIGAGICSGLTCIPLSKISSA